MELTWRRDQEFWLAFDAYKENPKSAAAKAAWEHQRDLHEGKGQRPSQLQGPELST